MKFNLPVHPILFYFRTGIITLSTFSVKGGPKHIQKKMKKQKDLELKDTGKATMSH